jgi:D-inositol-3-phosphate glycosyltransferase
MRLAVISAHTCPLATLGGKETGGMNVYTRETCRALGRQGVEVDIFTRSQDHKIPPETEMDVGVRVLHIIYLNSFKEYCPMGVATMI